RLVSRARIDHALRRAARLPAAYGFRGSGAGHEGLTVGTTSRARTLSCVSPFFALHSKSMSVDTPRPAGVEKLSFLRARFRSSDTFSRHYAHYQQPPIPSA